MCNCTFCAYETRTSDNKIILPCTICYGMYSAFKPIARLRGYDFRLFIEFPNGSIFYDFSLATEYAQTLLQGLGDHEIHDWFININGTLHQLFKMGLDAFQFNIVVSCAAFTQNVWSELVFCQAARRCRKKMRQPLTLCDDDYTTQMRSLMRIPNTNTVRYKIHLKRLFDTSNEWNVSFILSLLRNPITPPVLVRLRRMPGGIMCTFVNHPTGKHVEVTIPLNAIRFIGPYKSVITKYLTRKPCIEEVPRET